MTWDLRRRLGVPAALFVMALVASLGLLGLTEAWRRSNVEVTRDQELEATVDGIDRALGSPEEPDLDGLVGDDEFVALLDEAGRVLDVSARVPSEAVEVFAADDLDATSIEPFEIRLASFDDGSSTWESAAVLCADPEACEVLVVGRRPTSWWAYAAPRLPLGAGAVAVAGLVTFLGTRWLVGRSLRPVDRMRRELEAITETDVDGRVAVQPTGDELEALGSTMNATIARLAESLAAQRQFVSDSAHELRSPLAGIRATLELALGAPERQDRAIADAIDNLDRTTAIIGDLLVLARRDARPAADRRLADIDDLLREELKALPTRHADVRVVRGSIRPVQAMVDPGAVERMIRNLVDNAAVHGGGTVRVSLDRTQQSWVLLVEDDGAGIPEVRRGEVFERFRRLDPSRSRGSGGSGLGLAIVAGTVADHGGSVSVGASDLGGAAFRVEVPAL